MSINREKKSEVDAYSVRVTGPYENRVPTTSEITVAMSRVSRARAAVRAATSVMKKGNHAAEGADQCLKDVLTQLVRDFQEREGI